MTEFGNMPFTGLMVKAKPMPDLRHPRFTKWYTTSTYLSSELAKYKGHAVSGGRNFQPTQFAQRLWNVSTPPARIETSFGTTNAMDLTTPFYMLADTAGGTASTEDTIVGPDYYNLPLKLHQDLAAMGQVSKLDTDLFRPMFMRVLAIKHKFTFTNYSRFPLEIFYSVLPVGYQWNGISGAFSPHDDMTNHTFKKIVVPAVRDSGDRSQKSTIDLAMNLKSMFPAAYMMPPGPDMTGTTQAASTLSTSPWISLAPGATTVSVMRNFPPGQLTSDAHSSPDFVSAVPVAGLRMQWYAKLQQPRDIGITTEDELFTGGDYIGNNYDVHVQAAWLVDLIKVSHLDTIHTGEKAYPNTAA